MLIKRLYLRNFRVYEDELDLELPPGLVGIYGPNGAGKSTLLEAIIFTLWGKARTTKEHIRSAGVGGDCVTEVEFEHEGHLYLVRRVLKGINSQVTVEAHCDGALMSTGTRDAERFVESVLGMDDAAFRASVFTEQKQLAAFSNQTPAERRRLVLQLLGITPLDAARDAARKDARDLTADHDRLRGMLPDLEVLETEAADCAARAEASEVVSAEEATAAGTARERSVRATAAFQTIDLRRQEHEALVIEGRAARQEMDLAQQTVEARSEELLQLEELTGRLAGLEREAAGVEEDENLLDALAAATSATRTAEGVQVGPRPSEPDETATQAAKEKAESLRRDLAAVTALVRAAEADVERARQAAARSESLTGEGDCPTCGQPLGDAFEKVQSHRAAELAEASARVAELVTRSKQIAQDSRRADDEAAQLAKQEASTRAAFTQWEQADRRRHDAEEARLAAWSEAVGAGAARFLAGTEAIAPPPTSAQLDAALDLLRAAVRAKRDAAGEARGIRARLEARPGIERSLATARDQLDSASSRVQVLREKVKALDFRREALDAAAAQMSAATAAAEVAALRAQQAALAAATDRERAAGAASKLADGRAQHAKLADLESEARHRARAADLLSEFRNTVVASVGPRLAVHAADLFGELTDHEYEKIEVDPETYQLQISDGGRLYGLDRFSGSEIDLANLALRVAISEHIHFQSGGSVGLLVLDEVFGPLDDDRKARMLLALERLRGRFRQVLVVTHDTEIKEQLPNAIEVVKRPGRRATAKVLGD
ncbi:MAG TPA: SMC family ATPase [Acidimicrobiales bacterium]|nr:SMC family ATPase [Acidimicrobiales bacterium]